MTNRFKTKQYLMFGTALTGFAVFAPTPALADCLPNASGTTVNCTTSDPDGFNGSATNGLTINVNPSTTVSGTLSTGSASAVNNEGDVNVGSGNTAVSVGAGSTVTNASTATGGITGNILFGAAGTGQTNTLNNNGPASNGGYGIVGDITSAGGAFVLNNSGVIAGNVNSTGDSTINNSGSLTGNVTLGGGNDTVNNSGTMTGTVDMGAGTNVFNASNGAQLPTLLTADAAGTSTVNLGLGGGTVGAITNFDVMNVNGGTWQLGGAVSLADQINVNTGLLVTSDASFLGANTVVNNASVEFTNVANGTFSGDMFCPCR